MGFIYFRTRMRIFRGKSGSTSTPSGLRRANCGAKVLRGATPSIWTCGMTTLSEHDVMTASEGLSDLPRLPRDEGGPVFAEPWQAQAFALAVKLSEAGHFTWKEWASALAGELENAATRGEPDDGRHYYDHWLAALEKRVAVCARARIDRDAACRRRWPRRRGSHRIPRPLDADSDWRRQFAERASAHSARDGRKTSDGIAALSAGHAARRRV